MTALRLLIASEWRRQRRGLPFLTLVIVIGVGATMLTFAASRRAETAFARFRESVADGHVYVGVEEEPARLAELAELPGVEAFAPFGYVPIYPVDAPESVRVEGGGFVSVDGVWLYDVHRPIVLAGRLPDPAEADSIAVNEIFAELLDISPGDSVRMEVLSETDGVFVDLGVVGVVRTPLDLGANAGSPLAYMPPAFIAGHPEAYVVPGFAMVRLVGGDDAAADYVVAARRVIGEDAPFVACAHRERRNDRGTGDRCDLDGAGARGARARSGDARRHRGAHVPSRMGVGRGRPAAARSGVTLGQRVLSVAAPTLAASAVALVRVDAGRVREFVAPAARAGA